MLLTAYLDESGTHDMSPISVMAEYLGTAAQWQAFDADWTTLLQTAGLCHMHAVDLFKRTKQFKEWPAERVNAFATELDGVIARHMQLGFSVIIRDDDYRKIYVDGERPRRSRLDSKYGVCFRACLAFAPSYIASELRLLGEVASDLMALADGPEGGFFEMAAVLGEWAASMEPATGWGSDSEWRGFRWHCRLLGY